MLKERPAPRRRVAAFTVRALAANVVTTLALCAGMTAIRYAFEQRFELAVVFVIAASI
ncbi:MAG: CDP-diacylglycerol--serine O-phosphatidyltransferase, partial [Alphaproteobacteria bacterium]